MAANHCGQGDNDRNGWWTCRANIESIRDFAVQHGLTMKATKDPYDSQVTNISVTLTPTKFPAELFLLAQSIQSDINNLVDAISRDDHFLESALER